MNSRKLFTASAAAEIDQLAIKEHGYEGINLMRAAGRAAFDHLAARFKRADSYAPSVLIICGGGNNGGDGYVVGLSALKAGWSVTLVALKSPISPESQEVQEEFESAGGVVSDCLPSGELDAFDVVVDAILGIGLTDAPKEPIATLITTLNSIPGYKLALDVPSGVDATTGQAYHPCFRADLTVTFIVAKVGLCTGSALNEVGELVLEDLGVDEKVIERVPAAANGLSSYPWPSRKKDSHKGSFGHLLIAGAQRGMLGAGLLAGEAALRAGCGKATLVSIHAELDAVVAYLPELMSEYFDSGLPLAVNNAEAVAVGPGLGTSSKSRALLTQCLALAKPTVVDADGLNLLAVSDFSVPSQCVLTPHPAEAARLLGVGTTVIQSDRVACARQIASRYRSVCVLKGAGTVIADPDGEVWICSAGNPAMATAGMGDVLTGVIGALLAQGLSPLEAAKSGVYQHAAAADYLVTERGRRTLLASDVAKRLSFNDRAEAAD